MFNNAAQVWNHTFYWNCLKPNGGGEPTGKLADAINAAFGSFAQFKEQFTNTSSDTSVRAGPGWCSVRTVRSVWSARRTQPRR
jgi:Fe-Mn family superoxide dismutase